MEFYVLCLTIAGFVLKVECQNGPQKQYQVLNPDLIYFSDNRPYGGKNINNQVLPPSSELQAPVNRAEVAPLAVPNPVESINKFNVAQRPITNPNAIQRHSDEEPDANDAANKVQFDQIAASLTNFSLSVMRNVNEQRMRNTVLSPYSIATLLALLQHGATDQTLDQISVALQMLPQASAAAFRTQSQDIKSRSSRNVLKTANNIFLADAFILNPQFRAIALGDFSSDVTPTVFERSVQAAELINGWVASRTNNKINNLIAPESIAANTQIMLVNAMYFKGIWEIPFRPQSTQPDAFRLSSGAVKTVPFMLTRRFFKAGIDRHTDSRIVVLPFENQEYSLMIILPSTLISAHDALRSLTVPQLETYLNLKPMEVQLRMPKFSIRTDTDLMPVLKRMGINKIFEQRSDLSGIGMFRSFTPQVSSAVHSAVLSIDEEGGSAAAASAFAAVTLSNAEPDLILKVDRPFIAVLWDVKTKVPLFMAKIEDPSL